MTTEHPLTKKELITVLKEIGVATKDDLKATKLDLQHSILSLERRLKRRMGADRNKIMATIASLATRTPTLSAFRQLQSTLERVVS